MVTPLRPSPTPPARSRAVPSSAKPIGGCLEKPSSEKSSSLAPWDREPGPMQVFFCGTFHKTSPSRGSHHARIMLPGDAPLFLTGLGSFLTQPGHSSNADVWYRAGTRIIRLDSHTAAVASSLRSPLPLLLPSGAHRR